MTDDGSHEDSDHCAAEICHEMPASPDSMNKVADIHTAAKVSELGRQDK